MDKSSKTTKNRYEHFKLLFKNKGHTLESVSYVLGIQKDSLYRKCNGRNAFTESDIHVILELLNYEFSEVFI